MRKGKVHFFPVTDSTQDAAWQLYEAGYPNGTLVVAGRQSRGRGRHGRNWISPPGGLWFSLLIYPLSTSRAQALTLQAARALSQVLARKTGVAVSVKLPNDLYCGRRKLAGILLEVRGETAVLGVGVNVNCRTDSLPFPAVSVREVSGARQGRCLILSEFLEQLRLHAGLEA